VPEPVPRPFSYAVLRVVPRVERGECFNAGVVLFCRLAPDASAEDVRAHLGARVRVAAGDPDAGTIAALPPSERFGWLVAPSSTIIQPSDVHTGLSRDPQATLDALFTELVEPLPAP